MLVNCSRCAAVVQTDSSTALEMTKRVLLECLRVLKMPAGGFVPSDASGFQSVGAVAISAGDGLLIFEVTLFFAGADLLVGDLVLGVTFLAEWSNRLGWEHFVRAGGVVFIVAVSV